MHVRVVSFMGAKDIDAGVSYMRETVLPLLSAQQGYRGMTASADEESGIFSVLSVWDTAKDRDATERVLAPMRQEAAELIGGDVEVQAFEQLVAAVGDSPPGPGSALMVMPVSMDPATVDDNVAYFENEVAPMIEASPGFQGLRLLMNRATGEGAVGTVWSDANAREQAAADAMGRREQAVARGVTFGEVSFRDVVMAAMKGE